MKILKRILFFIVGAIIFVLGLICLAVPFLPFGWALIIMTLVLFMPYFPSSRRWLDWLVKRDRTGMSKKLKIWSVGFYNWCHDVDLNRYEAFDIKHTKRRRRKIRNSSRRIKKR